MLGRINRGVIAALVGAAVVAGISAPDRRFSALPIG